MNKIKKHKSLILGFYLHLVSSPFYPYKKTQALMRQIVRWLKMNSTALSATLGVMGMPLAVYIIVEDIGNVWLGFGLFITAILLLVFTMFRVWNEDKRNREEKKDRDKVEFNRFMLQTRISVVILKELEQLNSKGDTGISTELLEQLEQLEDKDDDKQ